jgi:hypothetical protein
MTDSSSSFFGQLPTSCSSIILDHLRSLDQLSLSLVSRFFLELVEFYSKEHVLPVLERQYDTDELWLPRVTAFLAGGPFHNRLLPPWRCKAYVAGRVPLYCINHDDEITPYNYNAYVRVLILTPPTTTTTSTTTSTTANKSSRSSSNSAATTTITTLVAARQSGQVDIWELSSSSTPSQQPQHKLVTTLRHAGNFPLTDIWVQEIHDVGDYRFVIVQEPRHSRNAIVSLWQHHHHRHRRHHYPSYEDEESGGSGGREDSSSNDVNHRTTLVTCFERQGALSISCVYDSILYLVKHDNDDTNNNAIFFGGGALVDLWNDYNNVEAEEEDHDHHHHAGGIRIESIHLTTLQGGPTRHILDRRNGRSTNNNNQIVVRIHTIGNRWLLLALQHEEGGDGGGDDHDHDESGWNGLQLLNPQTLETVWSMGHSFSTVRVIGRTVSTTTTTTTTTTTSLAEDNHYHQAHSVIVNLFRIHYRQEVEGNNHNHNINFCKDESRPELLPLNQQPIRRTVNGSVYPIAATGAATASTMLTWNNTQQNLFLWRPVVAGGDGVGEGRGLELWDDQGCCIGTLFVPQVRLGTTEASCIVPYDSSCWDTDTAVLNDKNNNNNTVGSNTSSTRTNKNEHQHKERLEVYASRNNVQNVPGCFVATDTMLLATYFRDREYVNPGILVYPLPF